MPTKRAVLRAMKKRVLLPFLDRWRLDVDDRRVKEHVVDALARSKKARLADILAEQSRDELEALCRALELNDGGRAKADIIARILGQARAGNGTSGTRRARTQRARGRRGGAGSRRVFSYVVANDIGFAPNPFHGRCTLACCKLYIRRVAQPGDLIVGLTSRCENIVYIMRVSERLTFAEYWHDQRFHAKRPDWNSPDRAVRYGDNIYEPRGDGPPRQHVSQHWDHKNNCPDPRKDLDGRYVLVAKDFVYFGGDGPPLPDQVDFLEVGRGHRSRFTPAQIAAVESVFAGVDRGVKGMPSQWKAGRTEAPVRARC